MKSTVLNAWKNLQPSHFNLTISQQQLQLFIKCSKFLEKQLQTFALTRVTCRTDTFSKELLLQSTYNFNFLSGYCSFWEQLLLRGSIWSVKFLLRQYIFSNTNHNRLLMKTVCHFNWREEWRLAIHFLAVLASFGGSA